MSLLHLIEAHSETFTGIVLLLFAINATVFYVCGRRAERRFVAQDDLRILFRERGASGHSNKSTLTKLGGASGVLEVIVTDKELWLKGIWPMFSYIGAMFDMTHRIPRTNIIECLVQGGTVELRFSNEAGGESQVVLELKNPKAFISALDA